MTRNAASISQDSTLLTMDMKYALLRASPVYTLCLRVGSYMRLPSVYLSLSRPRLSLRFAHSNCCCSTRCAAQMISGVGFYSMRKDRWAGIRDQHPGTSSCHDSSKTGQCTGGQITLCPIDVANTHSMSLNVQQAAPWKNAQGKLVTAGSLIAVEVLTEDGWRLPGFTRESCDSITGGVDAVAQPVTWSNGTKTVAELGAVAVVHGGGSSRVQFEFTS